MNRLRRRFVPSVTGLAVVCISSVAPAQRANPRDYRVGANRQTAIPGQFTLPGPGLLDTRVGDANTLIGSGGYNINLTRPFVPNAGNLYITGNVTGGRAFQARSPISDPSSLSLNLPSSSLSDFRRDSASLESGVFGRSPGMASPFFAYEQTTTSLGTLSAGLNSLDPLGGRDLYAMPQPAEVLTGPRFGSPYAPNLSQPDLMAPLTSDGMEASMMAPSVFLQPISAAGTTSFDAVPAESLYSGLDFLRDPLAETASQMDPSPRTGDSATGTAFDIPAMPETVDLLSPFQSPETEIVATLATDPLESRDALTGSPAPLEAEPALPDTGYSPLTETLASNWAIDFESILAPEEAPLPEEAPAPGFEVYIPQGGDVYQDLVSAYDFVAMAQQYGDDMQAATAEDPSLAAQYAEAVSAVRDVFTQPIASLAGSDPTAVQNLLREGESLVRQGKYYEAKALYERARVLDRRNPLAVLGQGHAMIAAGEYFSAAQKLSRAIEIFPGLAYLKLDLPAFITEPDRLEKRRADLERRLEKKEDYRYRFVLGYTEYYSGLTDYGLENLRRAAEQAPPDSGIAQLHGLLTDELPQLTPQKQP